MQFGGIQTCFGGPFLPLLSQVVLRTDIFKTFLRLTFLDWQKKKLWKNLFSLESCVLCRPELFWLPPTKFHCTSRVHVKCKYCKEILEQLLCAYQNPSGWQKILKSAKYGIKTRWWPQNGKNVVLKPKIYENVVLGQIHVFLKHVIFDSHFFLNPNNHVQVKHWLYSYWKSVEWPLASGLQ